MRVASITTNYYTQTRNNKYAQQNLNFNGRCDLHKNLNNHIVTQEEELVKAALKAVKEAKEATEKAAKKVAEKAAKLAALKAEKEAAEKAAKEVGMKASEFADIATHKNDILN